MEPFEIIGAPYTLYLAPAGTAFPLIDAEPAVGWTLVGTNGDRNYSDAGVTVTHNQTIDQARPAGATGPVKAWRSAEDLMISLTLWDLTLEQYMYVLNGVAPVTTAAAAGTAGFKKTGLSRGVEITQFAALLRGESPYGAGFSAQYEVPRCYQSANAKPVFVKGKPAGLDLEFTALEDLTAASDDERFGRLVSQHQAPLP
jgi:hypothetical protein